MLPSWDRLPQFVREQQAWLSDCLADFDHDGWAPHLAVITKEAPDAEEKLALFCLYLDFHEAEENRRTLRALGRKFYHEDRTVPVVAALSTEAWVAPAGQGQ